MKSKLYIILFIIGIASLVISIFQFKRGSTLEGVLSLIFFLNFFIGGIINKIQNQNGSNKIKLNYFNIFLQIAAFLLPFYFVFYTKLNENNKDPFVKPLWWYIGAGFCFYAFLGLIFL